jgi:cytidylate kinase
MTARSRPVVAIDGPAGAGKTTVTRRVAEALGYLLLGTGSLYRSVALAAQRRQISWEDEARVGALARSLAQSGAIEIRPGAAGDRVRLEGEDVSQAIRAESIGAGASRVSAMPAVREALLAMQRSAGQSGGVVLEGRDIGTAVFPDAEAKFFLTASVEERARRRCEELRQRGEAADFETVRGEVAERDLRDSTRAVAPLRQAPDAILVDSTGIGIDEVVERIVAHVRGIAARGRSG